MLPTSTSAPAVDEAPLPPRYRWLKRGLAATALLLVAAVLVWFAWDATADRRVKALVAAAHARGEPILPEDFNPPRLRDDENAAFLLGEAIRLWSTPPDARYEPEELFQDIRWVADYRDDFRAAVQANAESLALVRRARGTPAADWGVPLRSPLLGVLLPWLSPQRELARRVNAAAVLAHLEGHDAEAVRRLHDAFHLGEVAAARPTVLMSYLVRISTQSAAIWALAHTLPTIDARDPEVRDELLRLRDRLLDEAADRDRWLAAMQLERASILDAGELISQGRGAAMGLGVPMPSGWLAVPLRPMLRLDLVRAVKSVDDWCAAGLSEPPTSQPAEESSLGDVLGLDRLTRVLSNIMLPSFSRLVELARRARAERRMAAVAIAIRLFEVDHGRRPAVLTELIPNYLAAVPRDPFAPDGRPLAYWPAADPPRLTSLGVNQVDDGGAFELKSSGDLALDSGDLPFFLDGSRPQSPAGTPTRRRSAEADPDDGEQQEGGRDENAADEQQGELEQGQEQEQPLAVGPG